MVHNIKQTRDATKGEERREEGVEHKPSFFSTFESARDRSDFVVVSHKGLWLQWL